MHSRLRAATRLADICDVVECFHGTVTEPRKAAGFDELWLRRLILACTFPAAGTQAVLESKEGLQFQSEARGRTRCNVASIAMMLVH
jgi:hypothetical protein